MYDVYSEFDIQQHAATFIHYFEVLIFEDGKIEYAVPSHTRKAEMIVCQKYNLSLQELFDFARKTGHIVDYMDWLLSEAKAIAVWTDGYIGIANQKQQEVLRLCKHAGIYAGKITASIV